MTTDVVETTETNFMDDVVAQTKEKIVHVLTIFPALSGTMIQTGIGTATSPKLWRPILAELIADGVICEKQVGASTPHDRYQSYKVYHLKALPYDEIRASLKPPEPEAQPQTPALTPTV